MSHFTLGVLLGCSALVAACGGSVIFVEDDDVGEGGASDGGFGQGLGPQGASPPSPPSSGGAPPLPPTAGGSGGFEVPQTECGIACDVLFQCGLQPAPAEGALCPGFEPADQEAFSSFCVPQCENQQAALSLIDAEDCPATVETISSLSSAFADLCDFGF